jgi:flagellar basal body L-ring protein FlgH
MKTTKQSVVITAAIIAVAIAVFEVSRNRSTTESAAASAIHLHDLLTVEIGRTAAERAAPGESVLPTKMVVEVVQVADDGRLVLEGHSRIAVENRILTRTLTGRVQPSQIDSRRVVQSSNIANLIVKTTDD